MKSRNIVKDANGKKHIVWFGSCGVNPDGTKISASTFVTGKEAVISDMYQKLSLLEGELWYNIYAGLPLVDKYKSKAIIDSYVVQTISNYDDVEYILLFESDIQNKQYTCSFAVQTSYGEVSINV